MPAAMVPYGLGLVGSVAARPSDRRWSLLCRLAYTDGYAVPLRPYHFRTESTPGVLTLLPRHGRVSGVR